MKKKLLVIDVSNYIYRSFYGITATLVNRENQQVNAVFGFIKSVVTLIEEMNPDSVVFAMESKVNFKKQEFSSYKDGRKTPDELKSQFEIVNDFLKLTGLNTISVEGYEADDVIGSIAEQCKNQFSEILIASNDKDLMMFVNESVKMIGSKGNIVDEVAVIAKFGIMPKQITDYLILIGDAADNIKGLKGIGPKTAAKLLLQYGSVDEILKNKDSIKNGSVFDEGVINLNKKLVSIQTDLNIPELNYKKLENSFEMQQFLQKHSFNYLMHRFNNLNSDF